MVVHELKTWPTFFEQVLCGDKTFEFRNNDRAYQKGDHIKLREFEFHRNSAEHYKYTGRELLVEITFVLGGEAPFNGSPNLGRWVILAIRKVELVEKTDIRGAG